MPSQNRRLITEGAATMYLTYSARLSPTQIVLHTWLFFRWHAFVPKQPLKAAFSCPSSDFNSSLVV